MVKASLSRAADPGFDSRFLSGDFSGSVILVTLKSAHQWLPCQAPGVIKSAVRLIGLVSVYSGPCEIKILICDFYLSVVACAVVWADPSPRDTGMLLGCYTTNNQQNKRTSPLTPVISAQGGTSVNVKDIFYSHTIPYDSRDVLLTLISLLFLLHSNPVQKLSNNSSLVKSVLQDDDGGPAGTCVDVCECVQFAVSCVFVCLNE